MKKIVFLMCVLVLHLINLYAGDTYQIIKYKGKPYISSVKGNRPVSKNMILIGSDTKICTKDGEDVKIVCQQNNRRYYYDEKGCRTINEIIALNQKPGRLKVILGHVIGKSYSMDEDKKDTTLEGTSGLGFSDETEYAVATKIAYRIFNKGQKNSSGLLLEKIEIDKTEDFTFSIKNESEDTLYANVFLYNDKDQTIYRCYTDFSCSFIAPGYSVQYPNVIFYNSRNAKYIVVASKTPYNAFLVERLFNEKQLPYCDPEEVNKVLVYM